MGIGSSRAASASLKKKAIVGLRMVEVPGIGKVLGPPHWYREQLRKLREMPPPTLEQVERQFRASAEWHLPKFGHGAGRFRDHVLTEEEQKTHVIR